MVTVGLVAEGVHDFFMLDPFIRKVLSDRIGTTIRYRNLQPMPDQTGNLGDGGWSRVIAWCKNNAGDRLETFFTPLFAGEQPCHAIVVHLDGDALEVVGSHTSVVIPSDVRDVSQRVTLLSDVLKECLSLHESRRRKIAFAIPVLQTEAWILAAEGFVGDVEAINSKNEFRKKFPKKVGGAAKRYRKRALDIGDNVPKDNCVSFQHFRHELDSLDIEI